MLLKLHLQLQDLQLQQGMPTALPCILPWLSPAMSTEPCCKSTRCYVHYDWQEHALETQPLIPGCHMQQGWGVCHEHTGSSNRSEADTGIGLCLQRHQTRGGPLNSRSQAQQTHAAASAAASGCPVAELQGPTTEAAHVQGLTGKVVTNAQAAA